MLYVFNFTIDKFANMLKQNIELHGKESMLRDADLIFYYLTQKYSYDEMRTVIKYFLDILKLSEDDSLDKLLFLANDE